MSAKGRAAARRKKQWALDERATYRLLIQNAERFGKLLSKPNRRGCRTWLLKARDKDGYGSFSITVPKEEPNEPQTQKKLRAHRCAWIIANGKPVPRGKLVLHKCDTPPCCEPTHLEIGTQRKNRRDCSQRGRTATIEKYGDWVGAHRIRGDRHPNSKITEKIARKILVLFSGGMRPPRIAVATGVKLGICYAVVQRRTWRHVEIPK